MKKKNSIFFAAVNFCLNMWNDSGELDYLHKAIANIRKKIEEEEKKHE